MISGDSIPHVFTNGDRWDITRPEDFTRLEVRTGTDTEPYIHLLLVRGDQTIGVRMTRNKMRMLRDHLDNILS